MEARIILGGQPVNFLGALTASNEAAARQRDALHTRDYRNMLAQNGPGIMAGDQGALNALAGYDPAAALGVQGQRQDMQFAQQRMDMLTEQERRNAEEYARGLSKEQAAAEAAQIEEGYKVMMGAQSPEQWDLLATQLGQQDLVGQFANRQALAGKFMSMADVLKQAFPTVDPMDAIALEKAQIELGQMKNPPSEPLSSEGKLKADLDAGRITPEQFAAAMSMGQTSFSVGHDGTVQFTQGAVGADGRPSGKLTEGQSKDLVYWQRMTENEDEVSQFENELSSLGDTLKSNVPLFGNAMVSEGYQRGNSAAMRWLSGVLRKDTGAAVTQQEFELYGPMYLPMYGDTPAMLADKREARRLAGEAIRNGLGTAEEVAAYVEAQRAASGAPPEGGVDDRPQGGDTIPQGIDPADWEYMTPEERALFQ